MSEQTTRRPAAGWTAILIVAALGVGLAAGPALAAAVAPRYAAPAPGAPGSIAAPDHTISVTGSGKVTVVPDIAIARLGVLAQGPNAKTVRESAAVAMTDIVAALRALGISDKDIATATVSLSPVYDYSTTGAAPKITGYQLSNSVSVTVRDLSVLSDVLDRGIAAGANTVDGVSFDVADRTGAEAKARTAAAADARAKADAYAKSLGVSITGIASVSESVSSPVWYGPNYAVGAPADKGAQTPVMPGSTDIVIAVTVAFLIP
jgi:uncharacterized protein YggE